MASLIIEKPPLHEPVTVAEAMAFARETDTNNAPLFAILIQAAREVCEAFTGRSFCFKGYRQGLDSFPYFVDTVMSQMAFPPSYRSLPRYSTTLWNYSQMIKLFKPPLAAVESITFLSSSDNAYHELSPAPPLWYPGTLAGIGDKVMDPNKNVQQAQTGGTTNANPPAWSLSVGAITTEPVDPFNEGTGNIQWKNLGPLPANPVTGDQSQFGQFIVDKYSEPARLFPGPPGGFWPSVLYVPNAVQIHFTAGYSADGSKVPGAIKMAMLQCISHWNENREAAMAGGMQELPNHCKALLWTHRVVDFQPTRG